MLDYPFIAFLVLVKPAVGFSAIKFADLNICRDLLDQLAADPAPQFLKGTIFQICFTRPLFPLLIMLMGSDKVNRVHISLDA
jgi:hypothetical protein